MSAVQRVGDPKLMFNALDIRIKQIIQALPDAIIVADTQGKIKLLNPTAESTPSYTAHEAIR